MSNIIGWKQVPYSEEANQALTSLKKGEVLAVRAKKVKNGKIQIEFAEKIERPGTTINALGLFNKSDDRFSASGPRRTWVTAEINDASKILGEDISFPEGASHIDILKVVPSYQGMNFKIRVIEIPESQMDEDDLKYPNNNLKSNGKGKFFFTPSGERVGVKTDLVLVAPGDSTPHVYLESELARGESGTVRDFKDDKAEKAGLTI